MNRYFSAALLTLLAFTVSPVFAQAPARTGHSSFPTGTVEGRVLDDHQLPVAGAMVSVVGRTTAAATTDRDGRYSLRALPFGPYVLSVHSRGYWQSRGRTIQVSSASTSVPSIQLAHANADKPAPPKADATPTNLANFGAELSVPVSSLVAVAAVAPAAASESQDGEKTARDGASDDDNGETAWRLRHLPRSILKETTAEALWVANGDPQPSQAWFGRSGLTFGPAAMFSNLALSGQINLLTSESFNRTEQLLGPGGGRSVAFVSVGSRAAGGAWSMQGAMTQGDLASWIVAGSFKSIESTSHAYDLGMSYSTQRYDGGNAAALAAIRDSARNVGTLYAYDQWTLSPRLIVEYGTGYSRYDYLAQSGLWSPRLTVTIPVSGLRVKAVASERAVAPGAEEFEPSATGLWLPPERTFSSLSTDGSFRPERTRHTEVSLERDLAGGVSVAVRGFNQHVNDQLIEMFDVNLPGRPQTPLGHYFVGTAGDIDARGWGVSMTQEVPGYVRGTIEYTVATAYWQPSADPGLLGTGPAAGARTSENVYDLRTTIEATIPQTATKVYANYRMNTAFWSAEAERFSPPNANTRFNVRVNQSLPFLNFSSADWEAMVDVRNMFREGNNYASLYDEALAVRAPKRIVGGLLVKF